MEALRKTLELIFLKENPDKILSEGELPTLFCRKEKVLASRDLFSPLTLDQIETIYRQLEDVWMREGSSKMMRYIEKRSSIYNVLLNFSVETLSTIDSKPIVKYDNLLRWNQLTSLLTEDLLTTSFLASGDIVSRNSRNKFDWEPCVGHDNNALNAIFKRPMAELHSHLKGASLNFELNWISLMNQPWNRDAEFADFSYSQSPAVFLELGGFTKPPIYYLVIKAAAIRLFFVQRQFGVDIQNGDDIRHLLHASNLSEQKLYIESLKRGICVIKQLYSKKFSSSFVDYAISNRCCSENQVKPYTVLTGERSFMYGAFRSIYERSHEVEDDVLFYAYILIKNQFRQEMMQNNLYKGFANFGLYERRKEGFIPDESFYSKLVPSEAVASYFSGKAPGSYLEVRITPKPFAFELEQSVKTLVKTIGNQISIGEEAKESYRFILHYIKVRERYRNGPRHQSLRKSVKQCTVSLVRWRNQEFNNCSEKIVGIDAANSELYCRPEVFSQAYRFCRHYGWNQSNQHPNQLHFTYHVGEDFYDMIDGLRAIWETIHFLGLGRGDRIGHGLVLGTDVNLYYKNRQGLVYLPKQVLLDNIVWVLHEGDFVGPSEKLYRELKDLYLALVAELYGKKPFIEDYFQSMCLRGDNPAAYSNTCRMISRWNQLDFNNDDMAVFARQNEEAVKLYIQYHYDADTVRKGDEVREFTVKSSLVTVIDELRKRMLHTIESSGIAIETNPTSNLKIGYASTYRTLPLMEFNNAGIKNSGQYRGISVSINTDDSGVFGTSLEREYSLVAAALEKQFQKGESDVPPRAIYEWLDKIRQMSFEQKFSNI